jgi:hypothetical protein
MELPAAEARAQIDDIEAHYLTASSGDGPAGGVPSKPGSNAGSPAV